MPFLARAVGLVVAPADGNNRQPARGMEPMCTPGETQDVASSTYLYVLFPAGHDPDRDGLPADVDTLLAEVPETGPWWRPWVRAATG